MQFYDLAALSYAIDIVHASRELHDNSDLTRYTRCNDEDLIFVQIDDFVVM
jgi:hypothetical protein